MYKRQDLFWNYVASEYPEISSGDFPPDLSIAMADKLTQFVTVWLKMNEPTVSETKNVEIMLHNIEYSYYDDSNITDSDMETIAYSISQGISGGELCEVVAVTTDHNSVATVGTWKINNK